MKTLSAVENKTKRSYQRGLNSLRVASAVKEGETVTIGALIFQTILNTLTTLTVGNLAVDLRAAGSVTKAIATLTGSNSANATDGKILTINANVYRFKTTPAAINDIQIGASADATLTSLGKVLNGTGLAGTDYFAGTVTPNPDVSSSALVSHVLTLTARLGGTGPNAIVFTTNETTYTLQGTGTLGGAGATAGTDASASDYTTAFALAVTTGPLNGLHIAATRISANEVLVEDLASAVPETVGNAQATGVLTSTANYGAGETVTIGTRVYTFVTALTGAANEVLIGTTEAITITNLAACVNNTGTSGITFAQGNTADPKVTAVAATHTLTVTAIRAGTGQNAVAATKTAANASWGGATLSGGTDVSYFTATLSGANNAWAATSYAGNVAAPVKLPAFAPSFMLASRSPSVQEIALKSMHFLFGFTVRQTIFQLRDSTGLVKAFDGTCVISGKRVTISGSTSVNLATNDLVTVSASE